MRTERCVLLGLFFLIALIASDVEARSFGGGGLGGRGSNVGGGKGGKNNRRPKRNRKGKRGRNSNQKKKVEEFKKWALPGEVQVPQLDSSSLDSLSDSLKLTPEQKKKIEDLKQGIQAEGKQLAKAQADARAAYQRAKGQQASQAAAQWVTSATLAISQFRPNAKFKLAVHNLLNGEQRRKFHGGA